MFIRNEIWSTIINILLVVYWCEICIVNCQELLKFWEPNQDTGRRTVEGHKNKKSLLHKRAQLIDKKYDEDNPTRNNYFPRKQYYKVDPVEDYRHQFEEKRHRSPTKEPSSKKSHNWLRARSITQDESEKSKKYNRIKHKGRRHSQQSTRMTPMYLMQAEEDKKPKEKDENYKEYLAPYSIAEQLMEISEHFPHVNVTQEIIGRTVAYNDIVLIKATARETVDGKYFRAKETKYADEVQDKKIVFIVHGLSVMGMLELTCLSMMENFFTLLSYYFDHLDKFDIFIIPMANPDGYHVGGIWNKNMSPQNACPGVALDRNFDVAWNVTQDTSSCSQHYPGPNAFSEAESKAVRDVFHHYGHKIIAYFNVHSGTYDSETFKGDAILYPKGYTDIQSDDDKYIDLKGEVDEALKNASFHVLSVTVDTLFNWYTKVSGTSVDYASTVYGIPYAMELVMQLYKTDRFLSNLDFDGLALTQLWHRLINVIFNNIWRNTYENNDK